MNTCKTKRAFTLVELVVTMAVLGILTHLAVNSLTQIKSHKLDARAERELANIEQAIMVNGFVEDMGRLPRAVVKSNEFNEVVYTLEELVALPQGARKFASVRATKENIVAEESVAAELADDEIFIPSGWRGPYLKGAARFDPWGNDWVLSVTNGVVTGVGHRGEDGRGTGAKQIAFEGEAVLTVHVVGVNHDGTGAALTDAKVKWYMPCGGAITGGVVNVTGEFAAEIRGLTPGRRFVRVTSAAGNSTLRAVDLKSGANQIEIPIRIN